MRIVLFGDFHFPWLDCADEAVRDARDRAYRKIVEAVLAEPADYVVGIGDVTNLGRPEEFAAVRELFDPAGERFVYVLGNHDALLLPKNEIEAETGQPRFRAIEREEATLVVLDTARDRSLRDWSGTLDDEQRTWLADRLAEREDGDRRPLLIFAHHPPYGTTARSTEEKMHLDPAIPFVELLAAGPAPAVVFTGHNHVHSIVRKAGIAFVQTAAMLDAPGYRVIDVEAGRIRVTFRPIDDPDLRAAIARFHRLMPGFTPYPEPEGTEADRAADLPGVPETATEAAAERLGQGER
ncbi:metallophosphoesterase [Hydrogenibacillus schlegelii]|uniref:Calcineurin-like phosphoesterase domain-containing protein n=1 Tax=Hydrogenibacillus schlegelii TaxID=1484 RepID=A0A179IQZ9_HYDSH|nr:metallophosphoesterase [Hydrogenibacillus schlegelii]OAR04755.1 hypothetical protein SA87_09625 [Hydrogenibacillus schlegelii]